MAKTHPVDGDRLWPTMIRSRLKDGRVIATNNDVWLYRRIPLSPVDDAKTSQDALDAGAPIALAYEEIARATPVRATRRSMVRSAYRDTHALLVNVPKLFEPKPSPIQPYLREQFPKTIVENRLLVFGVKLVASVGTGGFKSAVNSVVESMTTGGTPMSDYDRDFEVVDQALARAGLKPLINEDYRLANAWWNHGHAPDIPYLSHNSHVHYFGSAHAASVAKSLGPDKCETWPVISDHHTMSYGVIEDFDLQYIAAHEPAAKWVSPLMDAGAAVISIRAKVEPSRVTREELRRQRKGYTDDLTQRMNEGKLDRSEHQSKLQELADVEGIYAEGNGPATLVDTSVVVGFSGTVDDFSAVQPYQLNISPSLYRQAGAWMETMMCSSVNINPHLHDLPAPTIAYSALPSLSNVGDREGALVGFTEKDRQPALLSPTAIATEDTYPLCVVAAASGAGKSMMMLWLADQYARMGRPAIIIDPKLGSDHSRAVEASGGQVASLDDLMSADGVLDPLRFSQNMEVGVEIASSMLLTINVWGPRKSEFEVPLMTALHFGVSQGANCIGQALKMAHAAGRAPADLVKPLFDLAGASPMFRALFGVNPATQGLRVADGVTLIKVGNAHLELPKPNIPADQASLNARIGLSVVRMMIFGSAMALTGRDGVILQDEAWTILNADPGEVERLGRLARSQRVLPILFSQDISGAVRSGLTGFISRGFIGPIGDETEAKAALDLFKIEATPERMARITAKATIGAIGDEQVAPNWNSMKALRDPDTRKTLRGSVWLYSDLAGRVVPVECTIPEPFLKLASTNAADLDERAAAAAQNAVGTGETQPV